tara:strand:- start:2101 stop:3006 length:906 start_codon:yes stop_codon:yes gene_type:complete
LYPIAILIGGPTASDKTKLAYEISNLFPSIIINADSMQVYKDLRILTNRPTKDDNTHNCRLFGFISYPEECNVGKWKKEVKKILDLEKNKIPIFVGGTGLYLDSLVRNISPIPEINLKVKRRVREIQKKYGNQFLFKKLEAKLKQSVKDLNISDTQRLIRAMEVKISTGKFISEWHKIKQEKEFKKIIYVVIKTNRDLLYNKINKRCLEIVENGVLVEIKNFLKNHNVKINHPICKAIGFRSFYNFILKKTNYDETMNEFMKETRRYAKRQTTWFKNRSKSSKHLSFQDAKNYIIENVNNF